MLRIYANHGLRKIHLCLYVIQDTKLQCFMGHFFLTYISYLNLIFRRLWIYKTINLIFWHFSFMKFCVCRCALWCLRTYFKAARAINAYQATPSRQHVLAIHSGSGHKKTDAYKFASVCFVFCDFEKSKLNYARSGARLLTTSTSSFTWLADSSSNFFSSSVRLTSMIFSTPSLPSTQGTPTK